jgi:hypothetical protein
MKTIESDKIIINRPQSEIFAFLGDFNHFEHLMPEQVINWKSTADHCSFTIQGMADIGLRIRERQPHSKIVIVSDGKVPFEMEMVAILTNINPNQTEAQMLINAGLNPFQSMLVTTPLTNFLNILVNKLKEVCESRV